MATIVWEIWGSTEESSSEDDAAADYAQSKIDAAFGISSATSSSSISSSSHSSGQSSSTTISSSTSPHRDAAPDITITTPTATPDCVSGYATYTMPAVASAPANAASLKFLIPKADSPGTDWEFDILPGLIVDPKTDVLSWQVGTSAPGPPITSGSGGKDMGIKWQAPEGASGSKTLPIRYSGSQILTRELGGTYVELLFTSDPPLGIQTYGVVAKGSGVGYLSPAPAGVPKFSDTELVRLYAGRMLWPTNSGKSSPLLIFELKTHTPPDHYEGWYDLQALPLQQ